MNRQLRRMQKKTAGAVGDLYSAPAEIVNLINLGVEAQQSGQFEQAGWYYQQALALDPNQPIALCNLGALLVNLGHHDQGQAYLKRALKIMPRFIEAAEVLIDSHLALGQFEAIVNLATVTARYFPNRPKLFRMLGLANSQLEKFEAAATAMTRLLELEPDDEEARVLLASSYTHLGLHDRAILILADIVEKNPRRADMGRVLIDLLLAKNHYPDIIKYSEKILSAPGIVPQAIDYAKLGGAYYSINDIEPALKYFNIALELDPKNLYCLELVIEIFCMTKHFDEANRWLVAYEKVTPNNRKYKILRALYLIGMGELEKVEKITKELISEDPSDFIGYSYALFSLQHQSKINECIDLAHKALKIFPNHTALFKFLAFGYGAKGDVEKSGHYMKLALTGETDQNEDGAYSAAIFAMHYDPSQTPLDISHQTRLLVAKYLGGAVPKNTHQNRVDPNKKIKVGYVSGDFFSHPVVNYIEPVLAHHDRQSFEVFCYYNKSYNDPVTDRLKGYADHWKTIDALSHNSVVEQIVSDEIDILIDLSGHTNGHRLPVFARKPAPIQATWIGYFNTTGLPTMDYIITDKALLPPEDEHLYTEAPLRLPVSGACYNLPDFDIAIAPPPGLRNGHITFGCFTVQRKHSDRAIALWGQILAQVPDAVLFLKAGAFDLEDMCQSYRDRFEAMGIDPKRLRFEGTTDMAHYLGQYNEVDLMLDTFPYNAATTCLQALWMGVPQISMRGNMLVSRIGDSLMTKVGLSEFVALTPEDYVAKAVEYAARPDRLAEIRARLRQTLANSPMTNPKAFTEDYEAALRGAWRKWCEEQEAGRDA